MHQKGCIPLARSTFYTEPSLPLPHPKTSLSHNPLENSTVLYGKSWNCFSSFFGSIEARDGKAAIAGGRNTSSETPMRPARTVSIVVSVSRDWRNYWGEEAARKRTEVGDGAETPAVRSFESSSLLEEGDDDGWQDQGGAVEQERMTRSAQTAWRARESSQRRGRTCW